MATDPRYLLAGLREYHRVLLRHLSELRDEFRVLEDRWQSFSAVYAGNAADQFRAGWHRTTENFREYMERGRLIADELEKRILALEDADRI